MQGLVARLGAFAASRRGNVAMIFALSLIPMTVAAGVGLDFARGMMVRQAMSEALDSAALAVGSSPNLTQASAQTLAQQYFNANYKAGPSYGTPSVSIPTNGFNAKGSVVLTATDSMPSIFLNIIGVKTLPVSTSSTVVWGQSKLWVSLVLDNSGSMADSGKMTALQSAAKQLLTDLQNASNTPGDVEAGIVPFTSVVNVGKGNVSAGWIDWSDWEAAPKTSTGTTINDNYTITKTNLSFAAYGPGDDCPFTTTTTTGSGRNASTTVTQDKPFGFSCTTASKNGSSAVTASGSSSPIPSSGNICPGLNSAAYGNDHLARYYNGCWSSAKSGTSKIQVSSGSGATCGNFSTSNCTCTGKNSSTVCSTQKWTHTWVINAHSSWGGCAIDRTQDYDIQNTQPSGAAGITVANPTSCAASSVTALGDNWTSLQSQVANMKASGSTNQAIGVAHGWQMLTPGDPYATPSVPAYTARYIILLSDGLNTQDRWWGNGSTENTSDDQNIDTREEDACAAAKTDGIIVYTLYVNINNSDGNSDPLQKCASDPSKYFVLTSASQIGTAFDTIAQQITAVRISK